MISRVTAKDWVYCGTAVEDGSATVTARFSKGGEAATAVIECDLNNGAIVGVRRLVFEPMPLRADAVLLRCFPCARLLGQAATELAERQGGRQTAVDELPDFKALRREWPKGDVQTVAKWVGYVYTQAVKAGKPSMLAVEESFGVSRTTARRMVAEARGREYIAAHVVGAPGSRQGKNPSLGSSAQPQ